MFGNLAELSSRVDRHIMSDRNVAFEKEGDL